MNRYGEKMSPVESSDKENGNEYDRYERVMYGGCGVRFGSFQRRTEIKKDRPPFDLLAFLGLRRKATGKEND